MVRALFAAGVDPERIRAVIPGPRFLPVDGMHEGADLLEAFTATYPAAVGNERRWFTEAPLQTGETTWVLSKMWGTNTEATLASLSGLADGFGYRAAED